MNIIPNSTIKICKNVPLGNEYQDTLYFPNPTDQFNYFNSKAVLTVDANTYQRVNKNTMRIEGSASDLYSANYLLFRNTSFGSKWFYAFIINTEYINNQCVEFTYQIDIIQTWYFEMVLKNSLVVREHTRTDGLYEHCEADSITDVDSYYANFEVGVEAVNEYVVLTSQVLVYDSNIQKYRWRDIAENDTGVVNNVYSGLVFNVFTSSQITELKQFVARAVSAGKDPIIAIYCASSYAGLPNESVIQHTDFGCNKSECRNNAFQGYTPKNNKLYNYPFCKLDLEYSGNTHTYAIEDFRNGNTTTNLDSCNFYIYAIMNPAPALLCVPRNYRGQAVDFNSGAEITSFPECAWVQDSYALWRAQNIDSGAFIATLATSIATNALVSSSDKVGKAITLRDGIQSVGGFVSSWLSARNKPDTPRGLDKPFILSNLDENGYRLVSRTVDYWKAKQIDDYFTKFGYQINKLKTPSLHNRSRYTYVQTSGCIITGDIPADTITELETLFDRGITWWADHNNVGNYDLTNVPLGE